jgi:hypothetical protein
MRFSRFGAFEEEEFNEITLNPVETGPDPTQREIQSAIVIIGIEYPHLSLPILASILFNRLQSNTLPRPRDKDSELSDKLPTKNSDNGKK